MMDSIDNDASWVESGYISHPATVNQIEDSNSDINERDLFNVAMFEHDSTIRDEPISASFEDIQVGVRNEHHRAQSYSVTSRTSTISLLFGGFTDCMQPVKTAFKGFFNPYKLDGRDIDVDVNRDFYAQGNEGKVMRIRYLGKTVAVKQLLNPKSFNPSLIEKLAKLKPENVVQFTGYTEEPPQYVMEFLSLGTLSDFIRDGGEIPPRLLVKWSRNIVNGLEHLHKMDLIHCDLKSANLMFDSSEQLKIIDLESSLSIPSGQDQVEVVKARGTTPYMSPEMIKQLPCTTMVDIWAFGIVLWEMVTLKPPYKGKEEQYVFYGIGMNKISLPIPEDIPEGIKLLLLMCWKQAPEARPIAFYIRKHLEELEKELEKTSSETYRRSQMSWRQDCEYVEYEFDMEEVRQWSEDLERYKILKMRYNALMAKYNGLYHEFKSYKKGQDPAVTITRARKRSCRRKKKTASKTSLLRSTPSHVLTRTVSAPQISERNTLHRITDLQRMCQTPRAHTLGGHCEVSTIQNSSNDNDTSPLFNADPPNYNSPIESDSSHSSRNSTGAHGDIESGAETEQDKILLSKIHRGIAKIQISTTTEEPEDSAFDLSLSSNPDMALHESEDEFADEGLDKFGVRC